MKDVDELEGFELKAIRCIDEQQHLGPQLNELRSSSVAGWTIIDLGPGPPPIGGHWHEDPSDFNLRSSLYSEPHSNKSKRNTAEV